MSKGIQPIRGMNDILPGQTATWQQVEAVARALFAKYGYQEIRIPLLERTELFKRSIGELSDIVMKEMYSFEDRNGESLTLRPEGTAGIVRAGLSNGLLYNQQQRLWSGGAMFRYERPQKGRYRQFHQLDAEALGFAGPDVDAELILLSARLWRELGVTGLTLKINSLGTPESRKRYREKLVEYFTAHADGLDEDSTRRLKANPMRILDSKNSEMAGIIDGAPSITDYLDAESAKHFKDLRHYLDEAGCDYQLAPRLVRGLDYYTRTVFEWVSDRLGAQDAVCSGGRYDGLVEQLGGKPTPAVGWALGMERLVALVEQAGRAAEQAVPDVFFAMLGAQAEFKGMRVAEELRDALNDIAVVCNAGGGSLKSQLKRADRSGAKLALIMGEEECATGTVAIKPLRSDEPQRSCQQNELVERVRQLLAAGESELP
ncbi:MAG: histidine--tRNA ligase [Gammaproteobacteria bacterium]|nr:histidine--tRNA ligase [Gammaproteobacteria bacterium]MCZ6762968.1 histidine--tRNA ligase [Gammaproteobacteria bacterium]MCZ6880442.1 histidine--tRNA ligase [Gammaproteobacteria bacterium]